MNKRAFIIIASTMFISTMGMGLLAPILPVYTEKLGASSFQIGLVQGGFAIGNLFSLPFVGQLSDRFGRKPFLCLGLTIITLASAAFIWAANPTHLILIRILQGMGAASHVPVAQAYLGDITPEGEEGKWFGYFSALMFGAIGIGPLIGGGLTDLFNINTTFIVMAAITLIGLVATIIFLQESTRKVALEHGSFISPLKSRTMQGVCAYRVSIGIGTSTFMAFIPILADVKLGINMVLIGVLLAMRSPVSIVQSYTGRLADLHDRRKLVAIGAVVTTISSALLPLSAGFWSLLVLYAAITLGVSIGFPAASAYVMEDGRTYGMGTCMTTYMMAMQVGNSVGPIGLGALADVLGLSSAFYATALASLLGMGVFLFLVRPRAQTSSVRV
jgi:DHA1 family multidrug resistance protein-like MFS transporter